MKRAYRYAYSMVASHALRVACCTCVLWAAGPDAAAQAAHTARKTVTAARVVTAEQGRAIVDAALQQEQPARGTQDCSHLVHQIYSFAGYEYAYGSSFELYAGHENFRRVRHPQAGDLITWPGHVGIVLEPRQHWFSSLVRSGLEAEDYRGPYWRSRGRPRFYRYVADTGGRGENAEARHASPPRASAARSSNATAVAERPEPEISSGKPAVQEATDRTPAVAIGKVGATNSAPELIPSGILLH